jgi:hypothetical protein
MPDLTPNIGLKKPLDNETADIAIINENMDTLDSKASYANKTETLSNKTLDKPKIANGGHIDDINGNEILGFTNLANAVNYLKVGNATATTDPSLSAIGDDSDIGIKLVPKGIGDIYTIASNAITFMVAGIANAVNYLKVKAGIAGSSPTITAIGTDTNIDINLIPKGTGKLKVNSKEVALQETLDAHTADNTAHITPQSVNGLDMNNIKKTGIYCGYNMTNSAVQTISNFIVIEYSPDWIVQIQFPIVPTDEAYQYIRRWHSATTWSSWKRVLTQIDYDQLFQYANDGKTQVANAITNKGVSASSIDTFSTLATKIGQIYPVATAGENKLNVFTTLSNTVRSQAPVKIKEIQIGDFAGVFRVKFGLYQNNGYDAYAQIYKNGVPYGTQRHTNSMSGVTFVEDLSFAKGDLFQIYAWNPSLNQDCFVQNVDLYVALRLVPAPTLQ